MVEWRYTLLFLGGLTLLNIVFGAFFRPLESTCKGNNKEIATDEEKASLANGYLDDNANGGKIIKNGNGVSLTPMTLSPPDIQVNGGPAPIRPFSQQMGMNGDAKYTDMARMAMSHPAFLDQAERPQVKFGSHSQFQELKKQQHLSPESSSGVMGRKDIFYSGSLYNIPEYKTDPHSFRRSMRNIDEDCQSKLGDEQEKCLCFPVSTLNKMTDVSLFKDPVFLMYAVSNFLTSIGFNVPYVFTVDRALLLGIDSKNAAYLLAVVGIANTASRVILGLLSDSKWVNRLYLYNSCLVICGVSMGLSVFCTEYYSQAAYAAIFGITSGAYVGLTSVVLVDLLGLDKLTNAFGLLLLFQGVASVMGPPLIGALYDGTGSYDAGFYLAGTMIFLSGAMLFAVPLIQKKMRKNKEKKYQEKPAFKITSNNKGQDDMLLEDDQ